MKKFFTFLLLIAICLGLCSCGDDTQIDTAKDISGDIAAEDDSVYDEIDDMLPCILKFVEYNHIVGNSIDYNDVNAEDFWNIVALAVASYPRASEISDIDAGGTYHLAWDDMSDIAKTFMYDSWEKHQFPSYKNSYSASADPGSGIIDLIPLGVDNYDASVECIKGDTGDVKIDYVVYIALAGKSGDTEIHHYAVYLTEWDKYANIMYGNVDARKGEHFMPYIVAGFQYLSTEDTADTGTVDESKD